MRSEASLQIDEELKELEHRLHRLKIEYEQYFLGALKREPSVLRGDVQRVITRYSNEPPRNAAQKFRFNSLCARYQAYRSMWGRIQREIEAGTYKRHRFKADLHEGQRAPLDAEARSSRTGPSERGSGIDRLFEALVRARRQTGEGAAGLDREDFERLVHDQSRALREQHGTGKVRFRVVIEGKRAKLKASVAK
jgi:hypothetical protein